MKRLTLDEWNNNFFARPRSRRSLYRYIKEGKIFPAPIKVGRDYEIESTAILLDNNAIKNSQSLMERINGQKSRGGH